MVVEHFPSVHTTLKAKQPEFNLQRVHTHTQRGGRETKKNEKWIKEKTMKMWLMYQENQ